MPKIGLSLQSNYPANAAFFPLLRDIGFRAISPFWSSVNDLKDTVDTAAACGLTLQSLHGSYQGLTGMWNRDKALSTPIFQALSNGVEACAAFGIPILVVHAWGGFDCTFDAASLYFSNFDRLVAHAQRENVQIAFENLQGTDYLAALMDRYQNVDSVGFCWDSGHELCYSPHLDLLGAYGDRLIMTHLNDNNGITRPDGQIQGVDDLHLLPHDGIADWADNIRRLKNAKKQEILNFELKIRPKGDRCILDLYSKLPLEQYLADAYQRAADLARIYFT